MTLTQPDRASYRWLFIALITLAGAYAWYGVTQYQRLNDLRQRQLGDVAAELTTTLETALRTLNEFDGKWRRSQEQGTPEPRVCDFDTAQPYLEVDGCAAGESITWGSDTRFAFVTSPALGFKARRDGAREIYFRFRADTLLRELAFPDAFPLIFVATGDKGVVLYQEAPARRQWLRRLRWGEQAFRDAHADRPPPVQVHSLSEMVPTGAEAWTRLRASSSRVSVSLGGTYHQVYLHPIVLDEGERQELVVGAAMPTVDIFREALALETHLLGVLVFLLLLCVLGFPFVKLLFLDAHERFRLRDVSLLYVSTAALLVLFTSAILAVDGYARWSAEANQGLTALARRLETRFLDEVAAVRDQVGHYDRTVSQLRVNSCKSWPVQTRWLSVESASADPEAFALPLPTIHAFLRQVAWIGPTGQQLWKATAQATPGKTNVGERPYFRAVRDESLFTIRRDGEPFFLGPDRSITDGKFYTYISLRSRLSPALCDELKDLDGPAVVAATTQLLSLDRQPLPAGYGFALINREGRVLYHSDRRLSLRENLFDQMSRGRRAHGLVFEGRAGLLGSRYREQPHEFYFHPVQIFREADGEPAGFYLAAFRDTSADRALLGWVFARGVAGPTSVLVVACALAAFGIVAVSRRTRRGWWAWLWPHGALNAVYQRQTIALLLILLVSVAAFMTNARAVVLAAGVAAVLAFVGIHLYGRPRDDVREPLVRAGWHTASIVLALTCVVVVPTAAVFQQALNRTFGDRIVAERALLEQQKADVISAAETEALAEYHARARRNVRVADREAYAICVPAPFDAADTWIGPAASRASAVTRVSRDAKNDPRAARRLAGCQSPHRESASPVPNETVASGDVPQSIGTAGSSGDVRRRTVPFEYSPPGTFVSALPVSFVGALACGLMLALSIGWVRWNTSRVFFANVAPEAPAGGPPVANVWTTLTRDQQMVLLQVAHERVANPYQRPIVDSLLKTGLLRLAPDLGPPADAAAFLNGEEHRLKADLRTWERVNMGHSWRYARVILVVAIVGLASFLFATQPGLQTSLLAIATGITGVLTTVLKMRDAILSWLAARKGE